MEKIKSWTNRFSFATAFMACSIMALNSGCVSGGFKLTRDYAGWVNKQDVVIRILLYILTLVVFVVTILIDVVINNTEDFWDGRVSQGIYNFYRDGKTYQAHHEVLPGSKLRRSTIEVRDSNKKMLQIVVFRETSAGEVELYVDGQLRTRVKNISKLLVVSTFDKSGKKIEEKAIPFITAVAMK